MAVVSLADIMSESLNTLSASEGAQGFGGLLRALTPLPVVGAQ